MDMQIKGLWRFLSAESASFFAICVIFENWAKNEGGKRALLLKKPAQIVKSHN